MKISSATGVRDMVCAEASANSQAIIHFLLEWSWVAVLMSIQDQHYHLDFSNLTFM